MGISDTSTFARKRPAGSVPGYSSSHCVRAFFLVSNSIHISQMVLPSVFSRRSRGCGRCVWPRPSPILPRTAVAIRATTFFEAPSSPVVQERCPPRTTRGAGSRRRRPRRRTSEARGGDAGACGPGCRPGSRPG